LTLYFRKSDRRWSNVSSDDDISFSSMRAIISESYDVIDSTIQLNKLLVPSTALSWIRPLLRWYSRRCMDLPGSAEDRLRDDYVGDKAFFVVA